MSQLNKFTNLAAYNAGIGAITKPAVSLIEATKEVKYDPYVPTFGGLQVSSGPLFYDGSNFSIKDSWNYTSYNTAAGKQNGSSYFNFIELGQAFDSRGSSFDTSSGDINNGNTLNGWRIPTITELENILGLSGATRQGSTVNNVSNRRFAYIKLSGITFAGSSTPCGILLFPDGETITGRTLNTGITVNFTESDLNVYLSQGCIFRPSSGFYYSDSGSSAGWYVGGEQTTFWTATSSDNGKAYFYECTPASSDRITTYPKAEFYAPIMLVK